MSRRLALLGNITSIADNGAVTWSPHGRWPKVYADMETLFESAPEIAHHVHMHRADGGGWDHRSDDEGRWQQTLAEIARDGGDRRQASAEAARALGHCIVTSVADDRPRSYDGFEAEDLEFLLRPALDDLRDFELRHKRHDGLSSTLICVALCQGAARHLVTGEGGVHDFDVWSFFREDADRPAFPVRRRVCRQFEGPRFLTSSRRIDLLGRTIIDLGSARASVCAYLEAGEPRRRERWPNGRSSFCIRSRKSVR